MYYQVLDYDVLGVTKCVDNEIFMWVGTIGGSGDVYITDRDFNARTAIDCPHSKFMNIDLSKHIEVFYCRAPTYAILVRGATVRGEYFIMSGSPIVPSVRSTSTYEFEVLSVGRVLYAIPKYLRDLFELPRVRRLKVADDMIIRYMCARRMLLPDLARDVMLMCCELYRRLDCAKYTVAK